MAVPPTLEIRVDDPSLVIATCEDLFIQRWRNRGDLERMQRMVDEHRRFLESRPTRSTIAMSIVEAENMNIPDEALRVLIKEHAALCSEHVRAIVTVIVGTGFASAAMRAVVSGLVMITSRQLAQAVRSTPRDGLEFLMPHRHANAPRVKVDAFERACQRAFTG